MKELTATEHPQDLKGAAAEGRLRFWQASCVDSNLLHAHEHRRETADEGEKGGMDLHPPRSALPASRALLHTCAASAARYGEWAALKRHTNAILPGPHIAKGIAG